MLQWAEAEIAKHKPTPSSIQKAVTDMVSKGGGSVDYVTVTDAEELQDLRQFMPGQEVLVAVAAFFGSVRLIDNVVAVQQGQA